MGGGVSVLPMAMKTLPVMGPSCAGAANEISKRGSAAWRRAGARMRQASATVRLMFFIPDNDILFLAFVQTHAGSNLRRDHVRVGVFTPLLSQLSLEDVLKKLKS